MIAPAPVEPGGQAFWARVRDELAALPLHASLAPAPDYSDANVEVCALTFRGLGGIGISGWVAAPRGPACGIVVQFPAYAAVLFPPVGLAEQGMIGVTVSVRGHHRSDAETAAGFPGLLTHGLPSAETYVYRGIYADALRAVAVLRAQFGTQLPMALSGQSQGAALSLFAAAMEPGIAAVAADVPFLCAIPTALQHTNAFPYRELSGYIRSHPAEEAEVWRTLSLFDIINFASEIRCPTLVSIGTDDPVTPLPATRELVSALPCAQATEYPGAGHEGGGMQHRLLMTNWLIARLKETAP